MNIAHQYDAASHKFTGKECDTESGLDNFGARYGASNFGRFMSPDPVFMGSDAKGRDQAGDSDNQTSQNWTHIGSACADALLCSTDSHPACPECKMSMALRFGIGKKWRSNGELEAIAMGGITPLSLIN
jgi:RHS repeat-associated protein